MNPVEFDDVAFSWPAGDGEDSEPVFSGLSVALPPGFGFLVGPNGIGKSTFMLLAGARVFPQSGTVRLLGQDASRFADAPLDPQLEMERNLLASFVYQNMEFETDEPIGAVFDMVADGSRDPRQAAAQRDTLVEAADLATRLDGRMHELSKGEIQRAIVVMSLLYGSPVVFMDEPVFAVEPARADRLMAAVKAHCSDTGTTVFASVHDVELARRYADAAVLFDSDGTVSAGEPDELLSRERLETAFRAPYDTLYERQNLYRDLLVQRFGNRGGDGAG